MEEEEEEEKEEQEEQEEEEEEEDEEALGASGSLRGRLRTSEGLREPARAGESARKPPSREVKKQIGQKSTTTAFGRSGFFGGTSEASWGLFWGPLGPVLGIFWVSFGAVWGLLGGMGPDGGLWEPLGGSLGPPGGLLGPPVPALGPLWEQSWGNLGPSWAPESRIEYSHLLIPIIYKHLMRSSGRVLTCPGWPVEVQPPIDCRS